MFSEKEFSKRTKDKQENEKDYLTILVSQKQEEFMLIVMYVSAVFK